jgi:putative hydrolase of HD superfamily
MHGKNETLLDLLKELQALDRVPRSGYSLRGVSEPESVSEHSFHTLFLAWALAGEEPDLDRLRVMEIALVHDLAEVRTGDLPRTAAHYLPEGAKAAAEMAVARDLLAPLDDRGPALLEEYQTRESAEARFVSTCDKLQLLIKARVYEDWGNGNTREFSRHLDDFADGGFGSVQRLVNEMKKTRRETTHLKASPS